MTPNQPLQQLTVPIARIGSDGLRPFTLPLSEAGDHLLGSARLLAQAGARRLYSYAHRTRARVNARLDFQKDQEAGYEGLLRVSS